MTTTCGTEPWGLGAGELAAAIRDRQVSSPEVVQAHGARILTPIDPR